MGSIFTFRAFFIRFYLILLMVYKLIILGKVEKDVRSEDEVEVQKEKEADEIRRETKHTGGAVRRRVVANIGGGDATAAAATG